MRRRIALVALGACLVPLSAAAQPAGSTTPLTQGPMIIEPIHSGWLAAPDVKVTEVDRKTSELVGGYAGWLSEQRFFIGGAGYWLANGNDREMAYGGLVAACTKEAAKKIGSARPTAWHHLPCPRAIPSRGRLAKVRVLSAARPFLGAGRF